MQLHWHFRALSRQNVSLDQPVQRSQGLGLCAPSHGIVPEDSITDAYRQGLASFSWQTSWIAASWCQAQAATHWHLDIQRHASPGVRRSPQSCERFVDLDHRLHRREFRDVGEDFLAVRLNGFLKVLL